MRANGNFHGLASAAEGVEPFQGDAQFRRRTTPEEVGGRSRNDKKVGRKTSDCRAGVLNAEAARLRIDQQRVVSRGAYLVEGEHQFQRNVRIAAAEVG